VPGVAIVALDAARVDELQALWVALQAAHRAVSDVAIQPDDELSWNQRRAGYLAWLVAGTAFVLGAERDGRLVGYAVTRVHDGPSNTFDLGPRHAEVYTLSVADGERGRGIGTLLLDAVDRELERRGIAHLIIAVTAGNDAARRLYERRGFVPAETVLFRDPPATS
jgi:ribosomal protein S18 acetylase RimI-like enzyme